MRSDKAARTYSLLRKTDGRADQSVLDYTHHTHSMSKIAEATDPVSLVLGLKGIGKSTAFKYFVHPPNETGKKNKVARFGFSPGSDTLLQLAQGTSGEFRERLYNILLMSVLSFAREEGLGPKTKSQQYMEKIEALIGPIGGKLETVFSESRKRLTGAFGFKFDLKEDVEAKIKHFDREAAEALLETIRQEGLRIHYFFDDPEMLLGTEKTGWDALAGLIQAADQVNTNYSGVVDVTVLLKSHLYAKIMDYEETANIYDGNISSLTWEVSDLEAALNLRLKAAGVTLTDVVDLDEINLEEDLFAKLRSGPRDLFVWLALAFEKSGKKKITREDISKTFPKAGKKSLQQITSGYKGSVEEVPVILRGIFPDKEALSYSEVWSRIQDLLVNDERFQNANAKNQFDSPERYIEFLTECGCAVLKHNDSIHYPYTKSYLELLDELENVTFELQPMLAAYLHKSQTVKK